MEKNTIKDVFKEVGFFLDDIISALHSRFLYDDKPKVDLGAEDILDIIAGELENKNDRNRFESYNKEWKGFEMGNLDYVIYDEMTDKMLVRLTAIIIKEYIRIVNSYKRKYIFGNE